MKLNRDSRRNKKKQDRDVVIGGRIVTSQEGRARAAATEAGANDKENKAEETRKKKTDADLERLVRRRTTGKEQMVYDGALGGQKRPDLLDIAWCMDLEEVGSREVLIASISAHTDANPHFRDDLRFAKLWRRSSKRAAGPEQSQTVVLGPSAAHNEDSPPDPKRCRVEDVSDIELRVCGPEREGGAS